ncbi:hypothetical protein KKE92_01815 [Candidatus Micrarchaeota archaeon]|nr:hypothetical protein [Candidatus Micrarchaeota archaeon]MBU1682241.1 hypothetical protein [Candidatus Micrarchaeota archaeon]
MKYVILLTLMLILGCTTQSLPEPNTTINDTSNITINDTRLSNISSFEECVAAGNPVMESYPRQCRSGAQTFVSLDDLFQVNKDTRCNENPDCILVDESLGFPCCWVGACAQINYSQDKWIAVNGTWFGLQKNKYCTNDCGPAPGCPIQLVNDSFEAICSNGFCEKVESSLMNQSNLSEVPENASNKTMRIEELKFGQYSLVLDDVVLPAYDATCGAFRVIDKNGSTIDNLLICEQRSKNWVSPDGHQYRILVVKVAAGYSHQAAWADVRIYG